MQKTIPTYLILFLLFSSCSGQTKTEPKSLYNEDFKWTITIPENFTSVSPAEWERLQNKGIDAIEKTYGEDVTNQAKTIFAFRNANFNYLESNYQPFDPTVDGDYLASCKNVNQVVFETFRTQMPNAVIDTVSSMEKISGLSFHTFKIKIEFPNGMTMHSLMYSRLFDTKEFAVNIIYVDETLGKKMLDAWTNSTFE